MDVVTDLTAEAVSYLVIIQDICRKNSSPTPKTPIWDNVPVLRTTKLSVEQWHRIRELIWYNNARVENNAILTRFYDVSDDLLSWLSFNQPSNTIGADLPNIYSSPVILRQYIKGILYEDPKGRIKLAKALRYMPLQVVLALKSTNLDAYEQRLYQVYLEELSDKNKLVNYDLNQDVISLKGAIRIEKWYAESDGAISRWSAAKRLIKDDKELLSRLIQKEIPLPFETIFGGELEEIKDSRKMRAKLDATRNATANPQNIEPFEGKGIKEPLKRAEEMKLCGLALSGGGIRSATFNLGLLQKLAEMDELKKFDYLSTVSGGGYIGSWLSSWIQRAGSVDKVTEHLDPERSTDPLADEIRPVRWLRMYSNYLSPNSSIMSSDAWTMGMTWLRNTLINQTILLLLLLTALCFVNVFFYGWKIIAELQVGANSGDRINELYLFLWSLAIVVPGAFLAGLGMSTYDTSQSPQTKWSFDGIGRSQFLSTGLIIWAGISAYMLTAWFYKISDNSDRFAGKVEALWPLVFSGLLAMAIVAFIGRYQNMIAVRLNWLKLILYLGISSLVATCAGILALSGVWMLIEYLKFKSDLIEPIILTFKCKYCSIGFKEFIYEIKPSRNNVDTVFIVGLPLILEVICISVVVRMAVMGSFFPDERREWWGKMGAQVHRSILIWLLVTAAVLLIHDTSKKVFILLQATYPGIFAGWFAFIGYAVKLAYHSGTSDEKNKEGKWGVKEYLIRIAPYLFIIGFLLLGVIILNKITLAFGDPSDKFGHYLALGFGLGAVTAFLSWRVGVNEFSLHYFYRNRLVRAYLGATRSVRDREASYNTFTGFDKDDDMPISSLVTRRKYIGPYPLINTALSSTEVSTLDRQDRKAESFIFSPLYCGFDFSPTSSASSSQSRTFQYGYRPTDNFSAPNGPSLGTAMAISGAAVNPNMGFHTSAAVAFLLTIFNVRLGWWIGNPRFDCWKRSSPRTGLAYLINDLVGRSDIHSDYVCLSDGAHFDNMGLYELVRRHCNYIVLGDAEEDSSSTCDGLANAIRRCRIDFGVEIVIDVSPITEKDKETRYCKNHVVAGTINYPGNPELGTLVYVKAALTGDEPIDLREYFMDNPEFPQESTGDQFFEESQFESYRKLGYSSIQKQKP